MTSPPDQSSSSAPRDRFEPALPSQRSMRLRPVVSSAQLDDTGFLESNWGTAIFLLIGLSMLVGSVSAACWLISKATVIAKSDVFGTFQLITKGDGNSERGTGIPSHSTPAPIPSVVNPPKPSRRHPHRTAVPILRPSNQPLPELSDEEIAHILSSLHPLEDDDDRTENIRSGFSFPNVLASQKDPEDCLKMAEVIRNTFTTSGLNVTVRTDRFFHPVLHRRIREQLHADILTRSPLNFELKYLARSSPKIRVVHLERYNEDSERTAYCHMGDNYENPFRYELVRERANWRVIDFESIDIGLSLSEVVAMSETLNVAFPHSRGLLYTKTLELINSHWQKDAIPRAVNYREYLFENVPNPLRDYYLGVTTGVGDLSWAVTPEKIEWSNDIEDTDRFVSVHRLRMEFAQREGQPNNVVTHGERYIDRAGYANPNVLRIYAGALIQLGRIEESIEPIEYLLTLAPKDEATIQMLRERIGQLADHRQIAPTLQKFGLTDLLHDPKSKDSESTTISTGEPAGNTKQEKPNDP